MISSMTGYGRGEVSVQGITVAAELRSVNSRFLEVTARLPRSVAHRENDIREMIRKRVVRGKISVVVTIDQASDGDISLRINKSAARASYRLLSDLRKTVKLREKITLDHLMKFSEVLEPQDISDDDGKEWAAAEPAIAQAIEGLFSMKLKEGRELCRDIMQRVNSVLGLVDGIDARSKLRVPEERTRLRERISRLVEDPAVIKEERLELELALLADRLDVTEECVRMRSHHKFFLEALEEKEAAGRKLGFLLQEMNREANTIGSKSSDPEISHDVVAMKEILEQIREQLQNVE